MHMRHLPLLFLFLFAAQALPAQPVAVSAGSIRRLENFSSKFVDPRNVDVWLPEGYSPARKYAVLYMHDGQMLYDSTRNWNKQEWGVDETMNRLQRDGEIRDCIVVGIWNNGEKRRREYFPERAFYSLSKTDREMLAEEKDAHSGKSLFEGLPASDNYLKFIVLELKPFIDSAFSTRRARAHTFIAGSSMGGLISMYAMCEYPKVFGGAACLSTHWVGIFRTENNPVPAALMAYLKGHLPSPKNHRFYFDYGTASLDALYPPFQKQADEIMQASGYTAKNWLTRAFEGEDHSERAWRKRLDIPLLFLLKK